SKSLGVNSSVTSAAKISAHGLPQTDFANAIIVGLQFSFDVSRQRSARATVSGVRQPCFFQMCGEFFLASLSLKPLERLTGLRDRAQYLAGDAYREQADRFITPYLGIPKL